MKKQSSLQEKFPKFISRHIAEYQDGKTCDTKMVTL